MTEVVLKKYHEIKDKIKGSHILLGNGFSVAYNKSIFTYDSISNAITDTNIQHKEILEKLNTVNIEFAMKHINDCISTIQVVDNSSATYDMVTKLQNINSTFKTTFQTAITTLHPAKHTIVEPTQKERCKKWLSDITNRFDKKKIFTLNFDLLLYWTLLQDIDDEKSKLRDNFQDKEGDKCYFNDSNGSKSLLFLHGALHLFHDKLGTFKMTYNTTHCLIEGIIENIKNDNYPLCIINGTSEEKLSDINNNYYLRTCLKNITTMNGNLVTYGWSWSNHDKHIIDAILQNNGIKKIYIGCFGEAESQTISTIVEDGFNRSSNVETKEVIYFDTSDVNPWEDEK